MSLGSKLKVPDSEMATLHLSERREMRYAVPFVIELSGIDRKGEVFHMQTLTRNVSQWGCRFSSPVELREDDIVALRLISHSGSSIEQSRLARFQVVRAERESDGWAAGVWKMDSGAMWEIEKLDYPQKGDISNRRGFGEASDSQEGASH